MKTTKALLDYLATCPKSCLESFELARLNERANLRKQMMEIIDEWVETDIQARIAEWVLVHRRKQRAACPHPALPARSLPSQKGLFSERSAAEFPSLTPNPVTPILKEAAAGDPETAMRGCIPLQNATACQRARTHRAERLYRHKNIRIA